MIKSGMVLAVMLATVGAQAAEPCAGVADIKSKSRQIFDSSVLMPHLMVLQGQGEANFHPVITKPRSQCSFEKFEAAGVSVEALYTPFEKLAEPTLLWQFTTSGAEPRTIQVVHDAIASMVAKKQVFFLVEERAGSISHFAIFREQPAYAALKPLVSGILDGSVQPLSVVHWPSGAKEPAIDAFDKRLK